MWTVLRFRQNLHFFRLKRPISLSLSLYITLASPLSINGFALICPNLSYTAYPKVDIVLQTQSYKGQMERKSPSPQPVGYTALNTTKRELDLLLQGHTSDTWSPPSALGLSRLFLCNCFPAICPGGCINAWGYLNLRHLPWVMRVLLTHLSVLLRSLDVLEVPAEYLVIPEGDIVYKLAMRESALSYHH